jgi:hypothetical protein
MHSSIHLSIYHPFIHDDYVNDDDDDYDDDHYDDDDDDQDDEDDDDDNNNNNDDDHDDDDRSDCGEVQSIPTHYHLYPEGDEQ